jgi:hypothetical protein
VPPALPTNWTLGKCLRECIRMSVLLRYPRGLGAMQTTWGRADEVARERNVVFAHSGARGQLDLF